MAEITPSKQQPHTVYFTEEVSMVFEVSLKTSFSLQCEVFGNTASEGHGPFQCVGIFFSG